MKPVLMIIFNGIMYFIQLDTKTNKYSLMSNSKPQHILNDISKVVYSDTQKNYLATKLRDMKRNGYRDHLVFESTNRELLFDFMVDYAYQNEDDIIFELNQEFSMLVNSSPIWFNFEDIDKCKNEQDKLFKLNDKDGHCGLV